jgi:hypothetical protein
MEYGKFIKPLIARLSTLRYVPQYKSIGKYACKQFLHPDWDASINIRKYPVLRERPYDFYSVRCRRKWFCTQCGHYAETLQTCNAEISGQDTGHCSPVSNMTLAWYSSSIHIYTLGKVSQGN